VSVILGFYLISIVVALRLLIALKIEGYLFDVMDFKYFSEVQFASGAGILAGMASLITWLASAEQGKRWLVLAILGIGLNTIQLLYWYVFIYRAIVV